MGENGLGGFSHDNPRSWFEDYEDAPGKVNPVKLREKYRSNTNKYVCDLDEAETKQALKAFLPEQQYYAMLTNSGKLKYSKPPFTDSFVIVKK